MAQSVHIPEREHDVIRLFALNLSEDEAQALNENPARIAAMLGLVAVDDQFLEVLKVSDVADIGLAAYLQEGYDIPSNVMAKDSAKLAQLSGHVLVLLSSAVPARPAALTLTQDLTLIGSYAATEVDWSADPTERPESATPYSAPEAARKTPSDAAMSGRIATLALLVLALLVVVMVWIA